MRVISAMNRIPKALAFENRQSILAYAYSFHAPGLYGRNGRERSAEFLRLSGLPVRGISSRSVRIIGTNGKSRTAHTLERMIHDAGARTVTLTSPHRYSIRERIRLDGRIISWERLGNLVGRISPILEVMRGTCFHPHPTDVWTWSAFAAHVETPGSFGIYEASLGGGSDVTNVFRSGIVGLTSIGEDHLGMFGGSLRHVLAEKLGICSSGDTLCYGRLAGPLEKVLKSHCRTHGVRAVRAWDPSSTGSRSPKEDRNDGEAERLSISLTDSLGLKTGASARIPSGVGIGDLQPRMIGGRPYFLDGAHNPPAMRRVVTRLATPKRRWFVIYGALAKKDWLAQIRILGRLSPRTALAGIGLTTGEMVSPETIARNAQELGIPAKAFGGMCSALRQVMTARWDACLVTGSFKLFRDFELALHALRYVSEAFPLEEIDPHQPWMRDLV